jgi:hypothetical protein
MKVLAMNYEVNKENSVNKYFSKVAEAVEDSNNQVGNIDLVVGPDYALSVLLPGTMLQNFESRDEFIRKFRDLSENYSNTTFLPGTAPYLLDGEMAHGVPLIRDGNLEREILKETDCSDSEIAERNGLVFRKGNNRKPIIVDNKLVFPNICSDHGKVEIPEGTFLEVVHAFDQFAGIYSRIGDRDDRYILMTNGYRSDNPKKDIQEVEARRFEYSNRRGNLFVINPILKSNDFEVFDFKEREE